VRSLGTGVPVVGGTLNQLNAATNAALAPLIEPFLSKGPDTLDQPTFAERRAKSLEIQNARDAKFAAEHPIVDTAAKLTGGVAGTVPLIAAAPAAFGVGGAGLMPSMAAGAVSGGLLGAGDAATRGEDIAHGAMFGAGGGAVAPAIGKAVGGIASKVLAQPEKLAPTTEELYSAASKGFDDVRNSGVQIKPEAVTSLATKVKGDLQTDGLRDYLAPKTFAALNELEAPVAGAAASDATKAYNELVAKGATPERAKAATAHLGTPEGETSGATFADLHGMRRVLGKAAGSPDPTERMAASRAISALDEYLGNIPKADVLSGDAAEAAAKFKDALGNYASAKRADTLAGKMEAADLQAATANSGQNIDNATRQRIKDILKSQSLRRGYSQDELLQMQKIARGTPVGNLVRGVGNLLGGGGGLGALITGGAGVMAAGPAGIAAPAAGYALKKVGNAMTAKQVAKLDEMIRSRSPEAAISKLQNQMTRATNDAQRAQLQRIMTSIATSAGKSGAPMQILPPSPQATPALMPGG
jgi:hypothetical protein